MRKGVAALARCAATLTRTLYRHTIYIGNSSQYIAGSSKITCVRSSAAKGIGNAAVVRIARALQQNRQGHRKKTIGHARTRGNLGTTQRPDDEKRFSGVEKPWNLFVPFPRLSNGEFLFPVRPRTAVFLVFFPRESLDANPFRTPLADCVFGFLAAYIANVLRMSDQGGNWLAIRDGCGAVITWKSGGIGTKG